MSDKVHEKLLQNLYSLGFKVDYKPQVTREELLKIIENYDIIIVRSRTKIDKEVIDKGVNLKIIARAGVGLDNIDVDYAINKGIAIVNSPNAPSQSVAELTIGLMICVARKIPQLCMDVKNGDWPKSKGIGIELYGKTLGIIGFGRIGRKVAKIAKSFEMNVIVYDIIDVSREANEIGVKIVKNLEELLSLSNVISLHVPLTKNTYHMINSKTLSYINDNSIIINTSRGEVLDSKAILEHIDRLWGIGIDVLETEPPRSEWDVKLIKHPKVVVTPHVGSETFEAQERIANELTQNIIETLRRM